MITVRAVCASVILFLVTSSPYSSAQPILVGCTISPSALNQPSQLVDIDLSTGAATDPRSLGISFVGGIATQPSTGLLFGLTTVASTVNPNTLIQINPLTGSVAIVGATGLPDIVEGDLAFNPTNGLLYGIQTGTGPNVQRNIFRIDPSSGVATVIGPTGSVGDLSALAFTGAGQLFALDTASTTNSLLLTIDPINGTVISSLSTNVDLAGC